LENPHSARDKGNRQRYENHCRGGISLFRMEPGLIDLGTPETVGYPRSLKNVCWALSLAIACGLVVLVKWHGEIQNYAAAHRGIAFYVLLGLFLAIPARIVGLIAGYWLELLFVGWDRSSIKLLWQPQASVRLDIISILTMLLLPHRRLGYLLSFGLLYASDVYAGRHILPSMTHFLPVWVLQAVFVLLFQSMVRYWMHRTEHVVPALWALHKFHHSAERMSMLTSARQTHLALGVEAGLVLLPLALLTSPTAAPPGAGSPSFVFLVIWGIYETFIVINGYLVHSNLTTDYGWIGRWLIVSPRMHRLHHAKSPEYHNKNFSFELVMWDRLFGTYASCGAAEVSGIPLGLEDNPFNRQTTLAGTLREYFVNTYWVFWLELKRGIAAWIPKRFVQAQTGISGEMRFDVDGKLSRSP
jgi:sterol desaturase/sphingolipid hydroxylase (fatty acid hydroxylase superfamily)